MDTLGDTSMDPRLVLVLLIAPASAGLLAYWLSSLFGGM